MTTMKKLIYLFLVLVLFPVLSFGQNEIRKAYLDYQVSRNRDNVYFNSFIGSPYEYPDFSEALVYVLGYSGPQKAKLRYNACFDEMEMSVEGKDKFQVLGNEKAIDSIRLNGMLYKYMIYNLKEKKTSGYLEQLVSGEINLYTKRPREIQDEKIPGSGYEEYKPPSIFISPELFFVQFEHGPLELLPATTKKIIAFFQEKGYDLKIYLKTEKIKIEKESLVKLVSYCRSIEKSAPKN
jgi:hypothetical protein